MVDRATLEILPLPASVIRDEVSQGRAVASTSPAVWECPFDDETTHPVASMHWPLRVLSFSRGNYLLFDYYWVLLLYYCCCYCYYWRRPARRRASRTGFSDPWNVTVADVLAPAGGNGFWTNLIVDRNVNLILTFLPLDIFLDGMPCRLCDSFCLSRRRLRSCILICCSSCCRFFQRRTAIKRCKRSHCRIIQSRRKKCKN